MASLAPIDIERPEFEGVSEKTTAPFKTWCVGKFKTDLSGIRASELFTTYFVRSYGELYEYGSEFIRVLHLINNGADQKAAQSAARRTGCRGYRPDTDKDSLVRRDENGKFRWMTAMKLPSAVRGSPRTLICWLAACRT